MLKLRFPSHIIRIKPALATLLFIAVAAAFNVQAQKPKHYIGLAEESEADKDYVGAAFYYKKAYALDSSQMDVYWSYAQALLKDNNYKQAETAFRYFYESPRREGYPEALYYLALTQQYNGHYKEASSNYGKFLRFYGKKDGLTLKAGQYEQSCDFALEHPDEPKGFEVVHLPDSINTIHAEFAPFLMRDSTLYFSALRYSRFDDLNRLPEDLDEPQGIRLYRSRPEPQRKVFIVDSSLMQRFVHVANFNLHPNGKDVVFTACKTQDGCAVYSAMFNDSLTGIKKLPAAINSGGATNTHPKWAVAGEDTLLLFSSTRNGGLGGFDLYASKWTNGEFGEPKNLGRRVNTSGNEITPAYNQVDSTLYFSSDWHLGYGGFDVFKSKGIPENLTFPENAGTAINSPANDIYFAPTPFEGQFVMTSNRASSRSVKGETCCNDIFLAKTKPPTGSVAEIPDTPEVEVDTPKTTPPPPPQEQLYSYTFYFPNDRPGKNSLDSTTDKTYLPVLQPYLDKWQGWVAGGDTSRSGFVALLEQARYNVDSLTTKIAAANAAGDSVVVSIHGYASPLADDLYNQLLARRRIRCLINTLGPELLKNPTVTTDPVGERSGLPEYLELHKKPERSVYSVEAAVERKVTVELLIFNR